MKLRRLHNPRGWTSLPNATLEDRTISWRARGILSYLLSRPDGWETDAVRLAALAGEPGDSRSKQAEGRDAVLTALGELERAHYLHRVRVQLPKGHPDGRGGQWITETYVSDHPSPDGVPSPQTAENPPVESAVDNSGGNWSPTPEKPKSAEPGSLTSTNQPQKNGDSQGDLLCKTSAPVENGAGSAGQSSPGPLASLPESEPAMPALSSTDAIAEASRLEPGLQMFALRAHLTRMLGYQPTFETVLSYVLDAHVAAPPSRCGRLRDSDLLDWVEEFHTSPQLDPTGLPAGAPPGGLPAADAGSAGGPGRIPVPDSTLSVNP